jgi:hypothetical protein
METFSFFTGQATTSNNNQNSNNLQITEQVNQSSNSNNPIVAHQHHDILTIFKITESSLQVWKSKYQNKSISYKLCIIDFKRKDSELEAKQDDLSSNLSEYVNSNSKVEIAVLNEDDCKFKNQETFGHVFNTHEYVFLKATIDDMSKWVSLMFFAIFCTKIIN